MEITITLAQLFTLLLYTAQLSLVIYGAVWFYKRNRQTRRVRNGFLNMHPMQRSNLRTMRLLAAPVDQFEKDHPNDLRSAVLFVKHKDGESALIWHPDGYWTLGKWTEGNGLEVVKLLRDCLVQTEQRREGFLSTLQPMLDEARDTMEKQRAASIR